MDSAFISAFNHGNLAFKQSKGEEFTLIGTGQITAVEIAELSAQEIAASGGKYADNTVVLHVLKSDLNGLKESDKIIVRGKRLRVGPIADSGDNCVMITAGPAGIKL